MRKLLLGAALAPLVALAHPAWAGDVGQPQDFYRYLARVASSVPSIPFIGSAADATFIGWTGGHDAGSPAAADSGSSGSSLPPRVTPSANDLLSLRALARAAVRSADRIEASR